MHKTRGGFTLTELLVVVAIVGIILAIVLPVVFAARGRAQQTTCLSNMRQISAALTLYTQDHDGTYPLVSDGSGNWDHAIFSYVRSPDTFHCPSCPVPRSFDNDEIAPGIPLTYAKGYALNANIYDATIRRKSSGAEKNVSYPDATVSLCEVAFRLGPQPNTAGIALNLVQPDTALHLLPGQSTDGLPGGVRHQGGSNYAFADGHAKWYKPEQVRGATAGPNDGQNPSFAL